MFFFFLIQQSNKGMGILYCEWPEYSPKISYPPVSTSGVWYKLKSVVSGTNVKIYINDKLAKEITMSGSGADAKSNNYVGIWCHARYPGKGDSFKGTLGERGHVEKLVLQQIWFSV